MVFKELKAPAEAIVNYQQALFLLDAFFKIKQNHSPYFPVIKRHKDLMPPNADGGLRGNTLLGLPILSCVFYVYSKATL